MKLLTAAARQRLALGYTGPGPTTLQAGNNEWGYYGELPSLISQATLATAIGLTTGTVLSQNPTWFKFCANGKTLFIPKHALRSNVTWHDLYKVGAVYGRADGGISPPLLAPEVPQIAQVVIGDDTFRVRLMKGTAHDPFDGSQGGIDRPGIMDGEFCRLVLPLLDGVDPGQSGDDWTSYSYSDLGLVGAGARTIVQEAATEKERSGELYRFYIGRSGNVNYLYHLSMLAINDAYGWRPVLELIV